MIRVECLTQWNFENCWFLFLCFSGCWCKTTRGSHSLCFYTVYRHI